MSSLPAPSIGESIPQSARLSRVQLAALSCVLAIVGIAGVWPAAIALWEMWTTDALKSIGMVVPVVSLVLILRVWKRLDWEMDGTWWGIAILVAIVAAVWLREQAVLILVLTSRWSTILPPPSLVAFAYGSGVVLLLGGTRLYRAALFPILLLWLVNPVPHEFSLLVDLPLQHASAHLARAFAMALGQQLTPDTLRLMFTPEFGMFIAPGCNGIRGAVTLGFIALVAGYIYRFRRHAQVLAVVGAVLLGYAFNLLRLAMLVLYYLVALHFTWLQSRAEMGDYIIGGVLFLAATLLFFAVAERLKGAPLPDRDPAAPTLQAPSRLLFARLGGLAAIALVGFAAMARARAESPIVPASPANQAALFPAHAGAYTLARTWNESLVTGQVIYIWAQYVPSDGGVPIAIGVAPVLGPHDVMSCHSARGEDPLWRNDLTVTTADSAPVTFNSAFFSAGATQYLEASTVCTAAGCGESSTELTHFGLVYSRPDPAALLGREAHRPVAVLIRAETIDMALPADTARDHLTASLRAFLAAVKLNEITRPYGH